MADIDFNPWERDRPPGRRERWEPRILSFLNQWGVCTWKGHIYQDEGDCQFCYRCFKTLPKRSG